MKVEAKKIVILGSAIKTNLIIFCKTKQEIQ